MPYRLVLSLCHPPTSSAPRTELEASVLARIQSGAAVRYPKSIWEDLSSVQPYALPTSTTSPTSQPSQRTRGRSTSNSTLRASAPAFHPTAPQPPHAHTLSADYRFGRISLSHIDVDPPSHRPDPMADLRHTVSSAILRSPPTPPPQPKPRPPPSSSNASPTIARFFPTAREGETDLGVGVVHLFRDVRVAEAEDEGPGSAAMKELERVGPPSLNGYDADDAEDDGTVMAVLAVPAHMSPADFLEFVRPAVEAISHLRMIRDSQPNRSIVLTKFRDARDAAEFKNMFNSEPFSSLEPEICHVVRVSSIQIRSGDASSFSFPILPTASPTSPAEVYELPTCPVCLDRMDATVTGLMTIQCHHTFHCSCLSSWSNSRCPVCRYSVPRLPPSSSSSISHPSTSHPHPSTSSSSTFPASSQPAAATACAACGSTHSLWVCLICGHVGCGRYGAAHAQAHFVETSHVYALELETQRVWDYAGDGYVHRLIQKADGKLVELPSASLSSSSHLRADGGGAGPDEIDRLAADKTEAMALEFSTLLTGQLDSQRAYYEAQQSHLQTRLATLESSEAALRARVARANELEGEILPRLEKERDRAEKKSDKAMELVRRLQRELEGERLVSKGLMERMSAMATREAASKAQVDALTVEVAGLKETVRDLMFFVEAREKVNDGSTTNGELAGGSVLPVPEAPKKKRGAGQGKKK